MRALAVMLVAVAAWTGCDSPVFETTHGGVDDGNALLAAGQAEEAVAAYEAAAAELPETAGLDYDRGLAYSAAGRHDEGTQWLLRALEARDDALRFRIFAGLGAAYGRWGEELERSGAAPAEGAGEEAPSDPAAAALSKWERAVEHLEKALLLRPEDEAVLRNLEVALLRVDPPCASRDDEYEPNDGPEQAALIEVAAEEAAPQSGAPAQPAAGQGDQLRWTRQLVACPDDADWLAIDLQPGDRLRAELTVPPESGRLGLALFAPGGQRRLRPPASSDAVLQAAELTVGPGAGGRYLLQVANVDGDEVAYGLEVTVRPSCERTEDHLEDNDGPEAAAAVTPGPMQGLRLCPLDEDWYALTLAEGESLFAFATLQPGPDEDAGEAGAEEGAPPLILEVQGPDGAVLARGGPAEGARVASLLDPGEGRYLVRVAGEGGLEARYDLILNVLPPCPDGDDELEDNDRPEAASDLAPAEAAGGAPGAAPPQGQEGPRLLRICPGDEDWLRLDAQPEQRTAVTILFDHEKGDLELSLLDDVGAETLATSDASSAETNGEGVTLPEVEEPTRYTLRVRGKEGAENFYLLNVQQPQGGGDEQEQDDQEDQDDEQDQDDQEDEEKPQDPKDEPGQQDQKQPDPQQRGQEPKETPQTPLEDALDKLDHNPENLEALQRARTSPLANHPPEKDW